MLHQSLDAGEIKEISINSSGIQVETVCRPVDFGQIEIAADNGILSAKSGPEVIQQFANQGGMGTINQTKAGSLSMADRDVDYHPLKLIADNGFVNKSALDT